MGISLEMAITFWETRGRWGPGDTEVLRSLIARCSLDSRLAKMQDAEPHQQIGGPGSGSGPELGILEDSYVRVQVEAFTRARAQAKAEGLEGTAAWLRAWDIAGEAAITEHVSYVAFQAERPSDTRRHGQRRSVNVITAAPGWIEYWEPGDANPRRIETSFAQHSTAHRSPVREAAVCPTCFMAMPATGECDSCG